MVLLLRIFYSVGNPTFAEKPVVFIWGKKMCKNSLLHSNFSISQR